MSTHIWLRSETKPGEKRRALSVGNVKKLLEQGFKVTVEKSSQSIFDDSEYAALGVDMVEDSSWTDAPSDAFILGLKELPESDSPLVHNHIYFAHAYKNQEGWKELLSRFKNGGGKLYDLEFLVNENNKRVAAFGYWAGFAGAGVGSLIWAHYKNNNTFEGFKLPENYTDSEHMINTAKEALKDHSPNKLRALITGMKGRSGTGAKEFFEAVGLNVTGWDKRETSNGGPFASILDFDIFVNCVLMMSKQPPFLDQSNIDNADKFCVISDVSCDPTGPYNSLPIYSKASTMEEPFELLKQGSSPIVMTAIDHLPSLLPRESSDDFSNQLLPHFNNLISEQDVWARARALFNSKVEEL